VYGVLGGEFEIAAISYVIFRNVIKNFHESLKMHLQKRREQKRNSLKSGALHPPPPPYVGYKYILSSENNNT